MTIVRRDSAFMYGNSSVTYGNIKLDAAEIQMDLNRNTVFALGRPDSTGEITGKPLFSENGTDYEAATMNYNFKTSKGYIKNVVTQQATSPAALRKKRPTKNFTSPTENTLPATTTTIRTSISSSPKPR